MVNYDDFGHYISVEAAAATEAKSAAAATTNNSHVRTKKIAYKLLPMIHRRYSS